MNRETYRKIYEKQAEFYRRRPWAKRTLLVANYALVAAVVSAYAAFCVVFLAVKDAGKTDFLRILALPAACLVFTSALRAIVNRARPYESGGIVPVLKKKTRGKSFPSRHVSSAFAIGVAMLAYLPWAGCLVLAAGAAMGYTRFASGAHYPSDLLAGALLGAAFGALAFL